MATEALVTEQTAEGHVEEVKLTNDVEDIDKQNCPESNDLEGKDEVIEVEDSTGVSAPATESETAVVSEEKLEDNKSEPATESETAVVSEEKLEDNKSEPAAESETAVVSEEKLEDNKSEPAAEEVEKEGAEVEIASDPLTGAAVENNESYKQEVDSSTTEPKVEVDSDAVAEAVDADAKESKSQGEVTDTPELPHPSTETSTENSVASLVQELESEIAKEPAVPEVAAEEANDTQEAAPEEANTAAEAAAEEANTTPEAVPVEVNTTEEFPLVSSVLETESKEADPPVVSPVTEPAPDDIPIADVSDTAETSKDETIKLEENTESEKEEPLIADAGEAEEVSDSVPEAVVPESAHAVAAVAAPVKELTEEGEEPAVTEDVSNVPQLAEGDQNASASAEESLPLNANPVGEAVESFVKPDIIVGEMQERAVVAEAPSDTNKTNAVPEVPSEGSGCAEKVEEEKDATTEGSIESLKNPDATVLVHQVPSDGEKASECVEEKKDESLEGEKPTSVETSRGIDVGEGKINVTTEADSLESEMTEKDEEKTPDESAKDAGEAPKAEVPTKSSQRQSNNIFSKVKQSIVKVKKAIIGKSPSSKTMSAEGEEEVKEKEVKAKANSEE